MTQAPVLVSDIWIYLLVPVVATVVGGVLAAFVAFGPKTRSGVQHFAAGVIFAAVAGELLPQLAASHAPWLVVSGFLAGVALMIGIQHLTRGGDKPAGERSDRGLLTAVCIDAALDGLLIGIAFSEGTQTGVIFATALSIEMFFLALSTGATLLNGGASRGRVLALAATLGAILAGSALLGFAAVGVLPPEALVAVGSFGVAALLYLVTEELLVEAHETAETPLLTSLFFVGFIAIFLLEG